tara:strand:- start:11016 stop:12113 length:1098 start_codon:yes stop_codon:yes gene_type:complete
LKNYIGRPKEDLDTPVVLVDLEIMEKNIEKMVGIIVKSAGVRWRPHTKAMKTPELAQKLLDAGASGITCAKLGEAEVMADAGITDILVANQIVGPYKIARLVELRHRADVMVLVDNKENIDALDRAAQESGIILKVLVEVNVGMDRAGVEPGEPVLELAKKIEESKGLEFSGIQTWESHTLKITPLEKKERTLAEAIKRFVDSAELCRKNGISVDILSCGGTGTYWISAVQPGITEIEAGGGIFCDIQYHKNFGVAHDYALTVYSTVTSRPTPTRLICDSGRKTMSTDAGTPKPLGMPEVTSVSLSAEHGIVQFAEPTSKPTVGDRIEFVVGYSDTTTFLHDYIYGIRNGIVETAWPLLGRGKLQ